MVLNPMDGEFRVAPKVSVFLPGVTYTIANLKVVFGNLVTN